MAKPNQMTTHCIACGYHITHPVIHMEDQPMVALALPKTQAEALEGRRFPMDYQACARCGHIFNVAFDISVIPYEDDSNLMYNHGEGWRAHIDALIDDVDKEIDLSGKTIVEIGCGNGHFLKAVLEKIPDAQCIGFEPGSDVEGLKDSGLEIHRDYFFPERDLVGLKPDVLVCRHVMEHLECPKDFVEEINYWANMHDVYPHMVAEVPRIDKAIEQRRIHDYQYEHVSNFTDTSFPMTFEFAGFEVVWCKPAYGEEVQVTLVKPKKNDLYKAVKTAAAEYFEAVNIQQENIQAFLAWCKEEGKTLAFWGGAGRGASFLNSFHIHVDDYPVVVDSDEYKQGRFVPGMGQEIRSPDYLREDPVDYIVISTEWRAEDIYKEIQERGLPFERVYVVRDQELTEYTGEAL